MVEFAGQKPTTASAWISPSFTTRRGFALDCLDWSERRVHLGGALGAALCSQIFALGWIERAESGRAVIVTEDGRRGLLESLGCPISEVAEKT